MQDNKEHLNVDLGFLDEAKPQEAQVKAASTYKVNWRNIAIIGGLIIAGVAWIGLSDNSSGDRNTVPAPYSTPSTYQAPVTGSTSNVSNGDFRCSSYDSSQADSMTPKNAYEITQEEDDLKRKSTSLESLKAQIDSSGVNGYSDQYAIDNYNAMVSRYNAELSAFRSEYTSHQTRVDIYNQQVQARNDYLEAHCRRNR